MRLAVLDPGFTKCDHLTTFMFQHENRPGLSHIFGLKCFCLCCAVWHDHPGPRLLNHLSISGRKTTKRKTGLNPVIHFYRLRQTQNFYI